MTPEQIKNLPYASAYARINDGAQIFVVLAFAEKNPENGEMQYKWMSSDRAMFIFEGGRLVKTIGLYGDNLQGATHEQVTDSSWTTQYDWMPDYRYGYRGEVTRTVGGEEVIDTPLNRYQTQKYTETVRFDAIDYVFTNHYWQSQSSGRMVKSIEYLGPQMTKIEFTVLKQPSM